MKNSQVVKAQSWCVFHLTNVFRNDGGIEMAVRNTVAALDKSRFDVWFGSLYPYGRLRGKLPLASDRIICFNDRSGFFGAADAIIRIAHFMREHSIEILHTHHFEANLIGRVAAALTDIPITIVTEHTTVSARKRWLHYVIDRVLARRTTQFIAVSEAVRNAVSEQYHLPKDRFCVVPNAVLLDEIPILSQTEKEKKRAELGLRPDQLVVISIGRLEPQKGHSTLIESARFVLSEAPSVTILIVGNGTLKERLQRRINQLGLNHRIRFLGIREDIYELLQISDVLVMPSLCEGLPIALLEAGACKIPVVASSVDGICEIITDGVNGYLVPPEVPEALASRLLRLLGDSEARTRFGNVSRHIVEEKFSGHIVARRLEKLYIELLLKTQ